MLEKKIEELGNYFDGLFRLKDGYNGVRVIIPSNWAVYGKDVDDCTISPVKVNDNNIEKVLFIGNKNVKVTEIMDFAKQVITSNIENERKRQLFNTKVAELAGIFDNNNLSKLENIAFKFEKSKKNKLAKQETEGLNNTENEIESDVTDDETKSIDIIDENVESKINSAILKAQNKMNKK